MSLKGNRNHIYLESNSYCFTRSDIWYIYSECWLCTKLLDAIYSDRIWYKSSTRRNRTCKSYICSWCISCIRNSRCIRKCIPDGNNRFINTFVVVNTALLMVVETVLDTAVCNAEGWLGSITCSNCMELKLEIGFILGMFVTSTLREITPFHLGLYFQSVSR